MQRCNWKWGQEYKIDWEINGEFKLKIDFDQDLEVANNGNIDSKITMKGYTQKH